ncbi:MAG: vWA domain-containing protein [bacterium]
MTCLSRLIHGAFAACLLAGSLLIATVSHAGSINPGTHSASLDLGEHSVVNATVQLDPGGPAVSKVDVVFLADNTGSMNALISDVKANADLILNTIAGASPDPRFTGIDVAFGVGRYLGDPLEPAESETTAYQLLQKVTTDLDDVEDAIDTWFAVNGGDVPEAAFYALHQVATEGGTTDSFGSTDPVGGYSSGDVTGWRAGAGRVIVWFGDARSHTSTVSSLEAIDALQAADVTVCAINTKSSGSGIDLFGQASAIAAATDGTLTNGVTNPGATVDAILDAVASVTATIDLSFATVPAPVAGLDISLFCTDGLGCNDVPVGDSRDFQWDIEGLTAGHYEFDVVVAGVAGAVSSVTIDVASGCGNGLLETGESCDDGDVDNGDGCSENCTVEECWECSGSPQVCSPDDGASCDDGEACTDNDECLVGVCSGDPVADNTPCDSGEACSLFDWCVGGACTGTLGTVVAEKSCKLGVESFSSVSLTTLDDRGRFSVGRDGFMADGTVAAAAVARLGIKSSIYDLEANAVNQRRGATIRGATDPWVDSGVVIADLCTEPIFACDENNDVTLDQFAMVTLSPGSYGDLFLGAQAQLILEAGDFDFCRIKGMPGTEIYITGSGPTVIRVRDRIITGVQSTLAPQGAQAPLIQSGGSVRLGVNSQTAAHIQAPENTVKLSRGARLNGTVCARKFATARVGELTCDLASPTGAFVDGPILF